MGKPYTNGSLETGPSKGEAYISSLYFILTSLTTVGFGNIAPNTAAEKVFSVVVLLLGGMVCFLKYIYIYLYLDLISTLIRDIVF